jgi:hypothetical protein
VWGFYLSMKNSAHACFTLVGIFISYFLWVPSVSYERHLIFLGIPGRSSKRFKIGFYPFLAISIWAFTPSSHENEGQPLLGSIHPKIQKGKEKSGWSLESEKYGWEWHDASSRGPPSSKPIPKGYPLTRA